MKKSLTLSLALVCALPALADLNGAGYYRVENYASERYVSVIDNRGSIDLVATSADLQAIRLWKDFTDMSSDPASVLYVTPVGNSEYEITAQATGIHEIIDHYVHLEQNGTAKNGQKLYMAYGTYNGVTRYLGDGNTWDGNKGTMSTNVKTADRRKWYILPITANGDNYFGAKPDVDINGHLYGSLYADFPMTPESEGVKFLTVTKCGYGVAVLGEVNGTVAKATPVIVTCAGQSSADNRITVGGEGTKPSTNLLSGVYFNCDIDGHINRTKFDPATMRVLGKCSDGSLGFITPEIDYIPANTAYLKVVPDSEKEIRIVSDEEFEIIKKEHENNGVEGIISDARSNDVYTITGTCIIRNASADQIRTLPKGIYIINGNKIVK